MTEKSGSKLSPPFVHSDTPAPADAPVAETRSTEWTRQEWRAFDWKSAASLRAPENAAVRAEREWQATEWDSHVKPVSGEAQRVAEQLDSVAQKIRSGELSIDGKAPTPETAMVAALEALIKAK